MRREDGLEDEVNDLEGQICSSIGLRRSDRLDEDALEPGVTTGSDMARVRGVRQKRVVKIFYACMHACECPRARVYETTSTSI